MRPGGPDSAIQETLIYTYGWAEDPRSGPAQGMNVTGSLGDLRVEYLGCFNASAHMACHKGSVAAPWGESPGWQNILAIKFLEA